jgi:hypothetical protein
MAPVMAHDQDSNAIRIHDEKQHRVRETMNDAAPDLRFDDRELRRVPGDPRNHCVDLPAEFQFQAGSGAGVEGRCPVYIADGGGVKLNPH